MSEVSETQGGAKPLWQPIGKSERRVLGVLVEKAKTTPENYPLSLASLIAGSNQKSNRAPQMQLDEDDVVAALDRLRALGAVREVQGSGRVNKFRHAAYEWLDVDAAGAAVMAELLLRGPQTAGELRARASRMHDFPDLGSLGETLDHLQSQGLVQALTPAGRGQTFAHALYPADEQQYLAQKVRSETGDETAAASEPRSAAIPPSWQQRIEQLEEELAEVKRRLDELTQV
ncbi:MAG: DUF480 domain-containing protein [Planctomycetaceae bacterium]|nr:MAG: DUF480 domain-containing protein [Planctomycetaceae bacterium]